MKKIFVASVFLGLASMAQAAFITCSPAQANVVVTAAGTSAVFTCSPGTPGSNNVNGDGLTITDIRIRVSGTFQDNAAVTNQNYSVAYSSTNTGVGFAIGNVACTASSTGDVNNQALGSCISTSAVAAVAGAPDSVSFTVTVTGAPGSTPLPNGGSASVSYEVNTQGSSPVPEPATYTMLGVGLVGFYLARRKA